MSTKIDELYRAYSYGLLTYEAFSEKLKELNRIVMDQEWFDWLRGVK